MNKLHDELNVSQLDSWKFNEAEMNLEVDNLRKNFNLLKLFPLNIVSGLVLLLRNFLGFWFLQSCSKWCWKLKLFFFPRLGLIKSYSEFNNHCKTISRKTLN